MSYKVRALELVFNGMRRFRRDEVFFIEELKAFDPASMEFLDPAHQEEYEKNFEKIVAEMKADQDKAKAALLARPVGKFKKEVDSVPGAPPKAKIPSKKESKKTDSGKHDVI